MLVAVKKWEEEWRVPGQRGGTRVGLWIHLECGHYPVQRTVRVRRGGNCE